MGKFQPIYSLTQGDIISLCKHHDKNMARLIIYLKSLISRDIIVSTHTGSGILVGRKYYSDNINVV